MGGSYCWGETAQPPNNSGTSLLPSWIMKRKGARGKGLDLLSVLGVQGRNMPGKIMGSCLVLSPCAPSAHTDGNVESGVMLLSRGAARGWGSGLGYGVIL